VAIERAIRLATRRACRRPGALAEGPRCDLPADHGPRLVKFISPTDPRWLSTLDALTASLVSDSLVYRYNPRASPDGVRGAEGTFSACSFWYVEALARAGRLDEARLAFEEMLTHVNHVGLYAEQIGRAGQQQGNFPQADPPGADQRRVQPRPWPRRVNHQDLVMTAHLPGGEARSRKARTATRVRPAILEDPSPR
jgi:pentatricopeptide repeat protein